MPRSNAKMRLKTLPQKLNFIMAKALSKRVIEIVAANALARSRIVTPCNTTSFSMKPLYVKLTTFFFTRTIENQAK